MPRDPMTALPLRVQFLSDPDTDTDPDADGLPVDDAIKKIPSGKPSAGFPKTSSLVGTKFVKVQRYVRPGC